MKKDNEIKVGDTVVPIMANAVITRGHAYKVDAIREGLIKLDGIDAFFPAENFAREKIKWSMFIAVSYSPKDGRVLGIDSVAEFDYKNRPEGRMSLFNASGTFSWLFYEAIKANQIVVRGGENEIVATAWLGDKLVGEVRRDLNPYRCIINK